VRAVTVRDPQYNPRQAPPAGGRGPARWLAPAAALAIVAVIGIGFGVGLAGGLAGDASSQGGSPAAVSPDPTTAAVEPTPTGTSAASDPGSSDAPSPDTDTAAPSAPVMVQADVAIVPVTNFRSGRSTVKAADVRAIAGGKGTYKALVLVDADADPILAALELDRDALGERLVTVKDAPALARNLAKNRSRLGFLRADEVGESVRALAWGSRALFGVDRVERLADWRLTARLAVPDGSVPAYDPADAWTIVAGGDILLDRGVALTIRDKGVNFPFDGGTVDITGLCRDCSPFGWDTPYTKRTGNKGAMREYIEGADLAIANFENPAPNRFAFHGRGTVFTANPAYIKGLRNVGIGWVSLANNHIGDAGRTGMRQTMANMDKYGIAHSGLGTNRKAAHKAALVEVADVTVGLLGYDQIAGVYRAGASTPGTARMTAKALKADVKAARKAGADVVIVFPHWGVEYRATPSVSQRALGKAAIDAGADMVIGNHAHWAAAMEVHDGKPIWYALGNFVFDQTWSIPTMEGVTLELTFDGTDLVQARMRPHLILDRAQPNFLDPLGDGKAVLTQIFRASKGLLAW
jgi:hypothetical protein